MVKLVRVKASQQGHPDPVVHQPWGKTVERADHHPGIVRRGLGGNEDQFFNLVDPAGYRFAWRSRRQDNPAAFLWRQGPAIFSHPIQRIDARHDQIVGAGDGPLFHEFKDQVHRIHGKPVSLAKAPGIQAVRLQHDDAIDESRALTAGAERVESQPRQAKEVNYIVVALL